MRILAAAAILLALAGTAGTQTAAPAAAALARLSSYESQLVTELNELRAAHGLRPLRLSRGLQTAAVAHSRAMLDGGWFAHEGPDHTPFAERLRRHYPSRGFASWSVGENLIFGREGLTAAESLAAWLASPGHRRILLGPAWREIGVGALFSGVAPGAFGDAPTAVVTVDFGVRVAKV